MAHGLPLLDAAFFIPGAQQLDDALVAGQIYPFMDNIAEILLPYYASTVYEPLFLGNFVDRVQSFDLSKWKSTYWNPLNLTTPTEQNRIYCTLGWTMHYLAQLLNVPNTQSSVLYYLTLFVDMHIPLIIYIVV